MTMTPIKSVRVRTRQEARPEARPGRARTRSTVQDAARTKGRPAAPTTSRLSISSGSPSAPRAAMTARRGSSWMSSTRVASMTCTPAERATICSPGSTGCG